MLNQAAVADLHAHSNRSDGLLPPAELVRLAKRAGLTHLALTDHDQLAGCAEALQAGTELGITVIPGVELSVRETDPTNGKTTDEHLLGWFVDPRAQALGAYVDGLQRSRREMASETLGLLAGLGMPLSAERVDELAAGAVVTRPHLAQALVEAGYVTSVQEAFERFLGRGKPAARERPAPSPEQAVQAVRSAGGVVGLAHPVFGQEANWAEQLPRVEARLDRLARVGVIAVECWYPDATPAITGQLLAWTRARGLLPTGGSDFHGEGRAPFAPLGQVTVGGDVVVHLEAARP